MMNENEPTLVALEQPQKLRRSKSREVSSRFQSPTSSSSSFDVGNRSPVRTLSPVRRKPEGRKSRPSQLDDPALLRGLWPSASASKVDTLADHLGHDRLNDILERNSGLFLDRCRSSRSESVAKYENDKETKENHRPIIGGSMRYAGNPRFLGKSSSLSSATKLFTGASDNTGTGASELGEACTNAYTRAKKHGIDVASKYMNDAVTRHRRWTSEPPSPAQKPIKRANSLTMGYGSSKTQWAMSPGRSESLRLSVESKGALPASFSGSKPPGSPSRTRGVEKYLSLGLEFLKSRRSSSSPVSASNSAPAGSTISETGHEFRMLYNRLMQWRYGNARADFVNTNVTNHVESNLVIAGDCLAKLRHSVAMKRIQLEKKKFEMKLNFIVQSQLKLLEKWGDVERQHSAAISDAKDSLLSVASRIPLTEGAEANIGSAVITFRHALDLGNSMRSLLTTFLHPAKKNVELMSELAKVVAQERLLLEECLELLRDVSILEIKESSLKCGITQMEFSKQQQRQEISL